MNREIKFRAWDKSGKMYIQDYCETCFFADHGFWSPNMFDYEQYTGLKDKNGVEIYEGDIVKQFGNRKPMKVEWHRLAFRFYRIFHMCEINSEALEVIGNIHTEESKPTINIINTDGKSDIVIDEINVRVSE